MVLLFFLLLNLIIFDKFELFIVKMDSKESTEEDFSNRSIHRPVIALSYDLIKTYKYINKVYHRKKAEKLQEGSSAPRNGVLNGGYDDENYDYIFQVFAFNNHLLKSFPFLSFLAP